MTTDPLDRAMREHFSQQTPDTAVLNRLRDATEAADRGRRRVRRRRVRHSLVAAAAILAFTALWLGLGLGQDSLSDRLTAEVALNHLKSLDLDFESDRYDLLANAMDKLEFTLRPPDPMKTRTRALIGARYCSILGHLAAQLRLEDPAGRIATLYQTNLSPSLESIPEQMVVHERVHVTVWSDDGVFFALAEAGPGAASPVSTAGD